MQKIITSTFVAAIAVSTLHAKSCSELRYEEFNDKTADTPCTKNKYLGLNAEDMMHYNRYIADATNSEVKDASYTFAHFIKSTRSKRDEDINIYTSQTREMHSQRLGYFEAIEQYLNAEVGALRLTRDAHHVSASLQYNLNWATLARAIANQIYKNGKYDTDAHAKIIAAHALQLEKIHDSHAARLLEAGYRVNQFVKITDLVAFYARLQDKERASTLIVTALNPEFREKILQQTPQGKKLFIITKALLEAKYEK
jgi:hypothetical protein